MIFVFGSNRQGIHGAGAALYARKFRGAVQGIGEGKQENSYAVPTCSEPGAPLSLEEIKVHVDRFLAFARSNPVWQFQVTAIGCGLAGHTPEQIAPMFLDALNEVPENVWLPGQFVAAIYEEGHDRGVACVEYQ
jgi:hypothetical protein